MSTESSRRRSSVTASVHEEDAKLLAKLGYKQELNRALGLFSSFGVQFTSIAVASAFYTTAIVGFGFFGPAMIWPFIIGGALQVFFVGLAVSKLVSAYPLCGGVYQITGRISRSPLLAWQSGWWLVIAHTVATAAVGVSLVPFIAGWFGLGTLTSMQTSLFALGLLIVVTTINLLGVKLAAMTNNVGVVAEVGVSVLIIAALLFANYDTQPAQIFTDTAGTTADGWLKPFLFAMILPAYLISSFDATGNASEETKDAAWTAPFGTFIANTLAFIVGLVLVVLTVRAIPNVDELMASATPVTYVFDSAVGATVSNIFEVIAIVALVATMVMVQLTGVRVLWSQARDGQMPAAGWVRKISAQRIPINATLVCAALSVAFVFWSSALAVLAALTALAWALAYGVVVTTGFFAVRKNALPDHPWTLGAAAPAVFAVAVIWSAVLCVLLVWSDWKNVGLGMLGVIAVGGALYMLIPASRRGKVIRDDQSHELDSV